MSTRPDWLDPTPWLATARHATPSQVRAALRHPNPGEGELAALLSPAAGELLPQLAGVAEAMTRRHFGRVISLYTPLYLSNYCSSGCSYCGFANDRYALRQRLEPAAIARELDALAAMGCQDVLLLTGERARAGDVDYVVEAVAAAAARMPRVGVEVFPMAADDYARLADAGCTSVTLYQETYDPVRYREVHRWGPKRNYGNRLEAPERALAGGIRQVGLGCLLGLGEPRADLLALYRHVRHVQAAYWRAGVSVSFPRLRPEPGGFVSATPVAERDLAQAICAFRIALPTVPLLLSTRERPGFRDGMAGIGVNRMSVASRTTVGGYADAEPQSGADVELAQFAVDDARSLPALEAALRARNLQPVRKDWAAVFRGSPPDRELAARAG